MKDRRKRVSVPSPKVTPVMMVKVGIRLTPARAISSCCTTSEVYRWCFLLSHTQHKFKWCPRWIQTCYCRFIKTVHILYKAWKYFNEKQWNSGCQTKDWSKLLTSNAVHFCIPNSLWCVTGQQLYVVITDIQCNALLHPQFSLICNQQL